MGFWKRTSNQGCVLYLVGSSGTLRDPSTERGCRQESGAVGCAQTVKPSPDGLGL